MAESTPEYKALEFAKQAVLATLQNSSITIDKDNGQKVGDYFNEIYEKSLEVIKKTKS